MAVSTVSTVSAVSAVSAVSTALTVLTVSVLLYPPLSLDLSLSPVWAELFSPLSFETFSIVPTALSVCWPLFYFVYSVSVFVALSVFWTAAVSIDFSIVCPVSTVWPVWAVWVVWAVSAFAVWAAFAFAAYLLVVFPLSALPSHSAVELSRTVRRRAGRCDQSAARVDCHYRYRFCRCHQYLAVRIWMLSAWVVHPYRHY